MWVLHFKILDFEILDFEVGDVVVLDKTGTIFCVLELKVPTYTNL